MYGEWVREGREDQLYTVSVTEMRDDRSLNGSSSEGESLTKLS